MRELGKKKTGGKGEIGSEEEKEGARVTHTANATRAGTLREERHARGAEAPRRINAPIPRDREMRNTFVAREKPHRAGCRCGGDLPPLGSHQGDMITEGQEPSTAFLRNRTNSLGFSLSSSSP